MGKWEELNDFSMYQARMPCPLCKEESEPTLVGGHFKCSKEAHLFNADGSKPDVDCYCDSCQEKAKAEYEAKEAIQKLLEEDSKEEDKKTE